LPTAQELVQWGEHTLSEHAVPDARRESEVLVARALGRERAWLYAHPEQPVPAEQEAQVRSWVERRGRREPLHYITGEVEFFGLTFHVDPRVLIPRPETEMLVEAGLAFLRRHPQARTADLCTGSGCVAVALAVNAPRCRVLAVDLSAGALAVARANAERHGVADRVTFVLGDLWEPLPAQIDLVLSNPPYVRSEDYAGLMPEVRDHEPRQALEAGEDGLVVIRPLLAEAPRRLAPGGALYVEIGEKQGPAVAALARQAFPRARIAIHQDLASLDRMLAVETE